MPTRSAAPGKTEFLGECEEVAHLFVRGITRSPNGLPNKGPGVPQIGRHKLVPYCDRAEIEDGAIAGRGLEIARSRI
jgi:hypothetical protein